MVDSSAKLLAKLAAKAREDINVFFEFALKVKQADCHRAIQAHADAHSRAGCLAHKGLGKTTQILGRLLWLLGRNPELRIKIVCCDDDTAEDRVMYLRDQITRNKRLRMVFPNLKKHESVDDWMKRSFTIQREGFSKDSSVEACGVLTSGTGARADIILFDDVVNYQNGIQYPEQRKKVKAAFKNVWMNLLAPDGKAFYIATKHHEEDLTSWLELNSSWTWIDLSVKGDPPVSPWPEAWTEKVLLQRLADIGTVEFDRCMRNVMHSDADRKIKKEWIKYFVTPPRRGAFRIAAFDYAGAAEEKGRLVKKNSDVDWTAFAVADVFPEERILRFLQVDRARGLTYKGIVDFMLDKMKEWTPEEVVDMVSGFEVIVGRDERLSSLPLNHLGPPYSQMSKLDRITTCAVLFEHGRIHFREGSCEEGITELINVPQAPHDDMADCIIHIVYRAAEMIRGDYKLEEMAEPTRRTFSKTTNMSMPDLRQDDSDGINFRRAGFRSARW